MSPDGAALSDNEHRTDARVGDLVACPLTVARLGPEVARQRAFEVYQTSTAGRGMMYAGSEPLPPNQRIMPFYGLLRRWKPGYKECDTYKSYCVDMPGHNALNAFRDRRAVCCHPGSFLVNQPDPPATPNVLLVEMPVLIEDTGRSRQMAAWRTLRVIQPGEPVVGMYGGRQHAYGERPKPVARVACRVCGKLMSQRLMARHLTGHALQGRSAATAPCASAAKADA